MQLLAARRDVRSFRSDALPDGMIEMLVAATALAPSVGLSQPARFVRVRDAERRQAVQASFERCNAEALAIQHGADAALYARLKLSGLAEAPEQLAVFCDYQTRKGRRLGRQTMPQTLEYSVVTAVHTLWLVARSHGIGIGWVSILDPEEVARVLQIDGNWKLVAYLCLGYPQRWTEEPELDILGWEAQTAPEILER